MHHRHCRQAGSLCRLVIRIQIVRPQNLVNGEHGAYPMSMRQRYYARLQMKKYLRHQVLLAGSVFMPAVGNSPAWELSF